jgi:hypothetical protein
MKYSEYQVWYHVYTKTAAGYSRAGYPASRIIAECDIIASHAVAMFKTVSDTPAQPNLDIQGLVDKVIKDSGKKK